MVESIQTRGLTQLYKASIDGSLPCSYYEVFPLAHFFRLIVVIRRLTLVNTANMPCASGEMIECVDVSDILVQTDRLLVF